MRFCKRDGLSDPRSSILYRTNRSGEEHRAQFDEKMPPARHLPAQHARYTSPAPPTSVPADLPDEGQPVQVLSDASVYGSVSARSFPRHRFRYPALFLEKTGPRKFFQGVTWCMLSCLARCALVLKYKDSLHINNESKRVVYFEVYLETEVYGGIRMPPWTEL